MTGLILEDGGEAVWYCAGYKVPLKMDIASSIRKQSVDDYQKTGRQAQRQRGAGCCGFLLILLTLFTPMYAHAEPVLEKIFAEKMRLSPEQITQVMSQPIPEHAQREIDYGFADETFVRFAMGTLLIRDKVRFLNQTYMDKFSSSEKINERYDCTSIGLDRLSARPVDCLYLWLNFLQNGPELPFEIDFPLALEERLWHKPDDPWVSFEKKSTKGFINTYKIPAYMQDDLLSLRIDRGDLLRMGKNIAKHPKEKFKEELGKIEKQPPFIRRFGRLICTPRMRRQWEYLGSWDHTCYAYWHRYMDMKGDGDQINEAYRNDKDYDPREHNGFHPPPPTRAEAELGELQMNALMWKLLDVQMCKSRPACSSALKDALAECRKKNEALRQVFLDDPDGDGKFEQFTESVHECVFEDKRLAPYLPIEN